MPPKWSSNVVHACHVMSFVSIQQGEGRWANESWDDTTAFLDRCASIGIRVLFDFSQVRLIVFLFFCFLFFCLLIRVLFDFSQVRLKVC